jgi:hypothetical protein
LGLPSLSIADPPDRVSLLRDGAINGFGISGNREQHFDLQRMVFPGLTQAKHETIAYAKDPR